MFKYPFKLVSKSIVKILLAVIILFVVVVLAELTLPPMLFILASVISTFAFIAFGTKSFNKFQNNHQKIIENYHDELILQIEDFMFSCIIKKLPKRTSRLCIFMEL